MSDYILALVFSVTITLSSPLSAAENCSDVHYSDFDFLVGEWLVHSRDGKFQGQNSITREEGGCLLVERWQGSQGGTGQSYNYFSPNSQKWYQLWVSKGAIINYSGGLNLAGAMHLEGNIVYQATALEAKFMGTWTPQRDGSVLQELKQFDETKHAWVEWFTGIYTLQP